MLPKGRTLGYAYKTIDASEIEVEHHYGENQRFNDE